MTLTFLCFILFLQGYLRCNQFIITQGPLKSTVDDFWRMVWEHRVSAIVMLCKLEEIGKVRKEIEKTMECNILAHNKLACMLYVHC